MKRVIAILALSAISAALSAARMPEGNMGIAAKYPGDLGIEQDPRVVFVERFDERTPEDLFRRYGEVLERETISFSTDIPAGAVNSRSALFTHVGGKGTGGFLTAYVKGYNQLYARWYVKFDPKCFWIHHFGNGLAAKNPNKFYGGGHAGEKPPGDASAHAKLEPGAQAWEWEFYTYWHEMRPCPPDFRFFGNGFTGGVQGKEVVKGKWICVEIMMKMNDPVTAHNGELACWVDGRLFYKNGIPVSYLGLGFPNGTWRHDSFWPGTGNTPFEGFQWRTSPDMNIRQILTGIYITKAPAGYVSKVWVSNVVAATSYIGPISAKAASTGSSGSGSGSGSGKMTPPPGW